MSERLSTHEADQLVSDLATVAQADLPLDSALRAAADELGHSRLARVMRDMAMQLEQGRTLADIVSQDRRRLPAFLRGVVRLAAQSGRLDVMLPQLVERSAWSREQQRRLNGALIYPLCILLVMAFIYVAAALMVIPDVTTELRGWQVELPAQTVFLIWWSEYGVRWALYSIPVILFVAAVVRLAAGAPRWGRWWSHFPLLGPAWHWAATARMAHYLSMLLELGQPLPEALRLTAQGVNDANVAETCTLLADDVQRGAKLSDALSGRRRLPSVLTSLVASGEKSGAPNATFHAAATLFDQWVTIRMSLIRQALPPVIFIFVAVGVLALLAGFMVPLLHVISSLS